MSYEKIVLSPEAHNAFVSNHPQGDVMQLTAWGELKKTTGWTYDLIAIGQEGEPLAAALILYRTMGPFTLAYAPRGPVVDLTDESLTRAIFNRMLETAAGRGAFLLKVDPDTSVEDTKTMELMLSLGYRHRGWDRSMTYNAQPRFSAITYLTNEPMEEQFNRLTSKVRGTIRRTMRNGLFFEKADADKLPHFAKLIDTTAERENFSGRPLSYFQALYRFFEPLRSETIDMQLFLTGVDLEERIAKNYADVQDREREIDRLKDRQAAGEELTAGQLDQLGQLERNATRLRDELKDFEARMEAGETKVYLAGALYLQCGKRGYYLYGGSSNDYRDLMPNYFMQWKVMKYAYDRGVRIYDMGGISGMDDGDPALDPAPGLWDFKKRFDAERVERLGEFDLVFRPLYAKVYKTVQGFREWRKKNKHD